MQSMNDLLNQHFGIEKPEDKKPERKKSMSELLNTYFNEVPPAPQAPQTPPEEPRTYSSPPEKIVGFVNGVPVRVPYSGSSELGPTPPSKIQVPNLIKGFIDSWKKGDLPGIVTLGLSNTKIAQDISDEVVKAERAFLEGINIMPLVSEGYKMWKNGDLPGMTHLITSFVSGGLVNIDPSKGITEGGLTSSSGEQLSNMAKDILSGRPADALNDVFKAIPWFGPMIAEAEMYEKEGEYSKAFGMGAAITLPIKAGQMLHNSKLVQAGKKAVKEYAKVYTDTKQLEAQISQMPEGAAKQRAIKKLEDIRRANIEHAKDTIKRATIEAIVGEDTKKVVNKTRQAKKKPTKATEKPEFAVGKPDAKDRRGVKRESPDRRKDSKRRKQVSQMTREELERELLTDELTGLYNRSAWERAPYEPFVASIDLDKMKRINDTYGLEAGDAYLQHAAEGFKQAGINIYRLGGDDFVTKGKSKAQIDAAMKKVKAWFEKNPAKIKTKDGKVVEVKVGFSHGSDKTPELAFQAMKKEKARALAAGEIEARYGEDASKINATQGPDISQMIIGPDDIVAIERHFGKSLDEISDADIAVFMAERRKTVPAPEIPAEEAAIDVSSLSEEQTIAAMEKKYGKSIGELTEAEIDEFYGIGADDVLSEIDQQTGSPTPPELESIDGSPFSESRETMLMRKKAYDNNKSVGVSVDDVLNQDPTRPLRDPGTTAYKLVNDVNRYLHGEDIDIAGTREFLSELAARADEFKGQFIGFDKPGEYEAAFHTWKQFVTDAAEWARQADREGLSTTGKSPFHKMASSLHFGLPIDESAKIIKHWFSSLRRYAEQKLPNRASKDQIVATLRKGSTQDEWNAVGLEEILDDGKSYTKEEILKVIDEGTVELKDVMLRDMSEQDIMNAGSIDDLGSYRSTKFGIYVEPGGTNYKELFVTAPDELKSKQWRDGHADYSDIENPIVRLRMNDRIDAQGNKVLFIEEIQAPQPGEFEKMPAQWQKRWREIGMKRAIKYAIDNGYDKVAWTTGEMQAKRYSLERHIDGISYLKRRDGNYYVVLRKDGNPISDHTWNFDQIRENLGEDTAKRIAETADDNPKSLSVDEINVGGQGLRKLYDRDLPNVAKKLGGKVETTELSFSSGLVSPVQSISVAPLRAKASDGFTLYSGPPLDKIIEQGKLIGDYIRKSEAAKKMKLSEITTIVKENLNKQWVSQSGNIRKRLLNYGDKGFDILQAMTLAKGAHPRATNTLRQLRREYRKGLSRVEKKATDGLILAMRMLAISKTPSGKRFKYPEELRPEASQRYIEGLKFKAINGIADFTPAQEARIRKAAETFFEYERKVVRDAYDAGLIGEQELSDLLAHNYMRIRPAEATWAKIFDKERKVTIGGKRRTVYDSGIDTLAKGKVTDIYETNSELVALEVFNRLYNRIENNKANLELLDVARNDKKNPFVMIDEPEAVNMATQPTTRREITRSIHIKKDRSGMSDYEYRQMLKKNYKVSTTKRMNIDQLKHLDEHLGERGWSKTGGQPSMEYVKGTQRKVPKGWKRSFVYEKGSRRSLWLEPKFADEWLTSNPEMTGSLARFVRWATLSPITRAFATGIEPMFALRNLPRDVMHAWFAARTFRDGKWQSVYSPIAPKFVVQMAKDMKDVFYDTVHRTGKYNDYIDDGGGMDFLTTQGRPFTKGLKLESGMDKAMDILGYINESSEILTRLAIRERVIKNRAKELGISVEEARKRKDIRREATFAAVDYMNFGDGGGFSKAVDNAIPYFNARLVATRSLFRVFKDKGSAVESVAKLGQFAALVAGLYLGFKHLAPETMKALKDDPRTSGSLIFPLGDKFAFKDEQGQTRYPFIKIPIDQSQRFFKVLFEAFIDKWLGEEVDSDKIVQSLKDSTPVDISQLPPTVSAALGYWLNKDLWIGRDIWTRTNEPFRYPNSREEFIPGKTPQMLIDLGKATGLSPERVKYVIGELITSDSIYSKMLFKGYDEIFGQLPEDMRGELLYEALANSPGSKTFFGVTNPSFEGRPAIEDISEKRAVIRWTQDRGLDILVNGYLYKKNVTMKEIVNYVESFKDPDVQDRLRADVDFSLAIKDLEHRSWWLALRRLDTQGRAEAYVDRMQKASDEEIKQINKETETILEVGGIITDDFKKRVDYILSGQPELD